MTALIAAQGIGGLWGHAGWMFASFVFFGLLKGRR